MSTKLFAFLDNPDIEWTLRINEHLRTQRYYENKMVKHASMEEYIANLNKGIEPIFIDPESEAGEAILKHNCIVELYIRAADNSFHYSIIGYSVARVYQSATALLELVKKI